MPQIIQINYVDAKYFTPNLLKTHSSACFFLIYERYKIQSTNKIIILSCQYFVLHLDDTVSFICELDRVVWRPRLIIIESARDLI